MLPPVMGHAGHACLPRGAGIASKTQSRMRLARPVPVAGTA